MKGNFQLIITIIFIALAILGILVFSGAIPIGNSNAPGSLGTVVLWGTVSTSTMAPLIEEFNAANPTFIVKYKQKNANTFDQDLLEALARDIGPDMIFLPDNLAFHYANKIFTVPYSSYSMASFKSNFAGAGEVFLASKGILAFPISIDPLVMYYNRSILDANSVVYPPAFWDDLIKLVPVLTKKDDENKIIESTVALGHFSNIIHAKDILSALFMQAGNPIISEKDGVFNSSLTMSNQKYDINSILKFYTDFADPNQTVYSWNRSFPNSNAVFSKEDLAFYFGFASELPSLVNKNPNQNFAVASFPQIRNSNLKLTASHVTGIAILSSSQNSATALTAASLLATGNFAAKFATAQGVAPARRDLLSLKPTDSYFPIFYSSALYAKSWLDPSPQNTDDIFRNMIDGVLSHSMTVAGAISDANNKLNLLLINQ
jgi:ABC-type glycerol-3-phosphate transport system substrate-binding protein